MSHANQLECVRSEKKSSNLTFTSADAKELTVNPLVAFLHAFYITST